MQEKTSLQLGLLVSVGNWASWQVGCEPSFPCSYACETCFSWLRYLKKKKLSTSQLKQSSSPAPPQPYPPLLPSHFIWQDCCESLFLGISNIRPLRFLLLSALISLLRGVAMWGHSCCLWCKKNLWGSVLWTWLSFHASLHRDGLVYIFLMPHLLNQKWDYPCVSLY